MPGQDTPRLTKPSNNVRFLRIFGGLLAAFIVVTLSLPSIVSTSWGKERVVALINEHIPGSVEIDDLSLGWFGHQTAQGITVRDPDGQVVLTINRMATDASPLSLLISHMDLGNAEIHGLHADLIPDGQGHTSLHSAFIKPETKVDLEPSEDLVAERKIPTQSSISVPFKGRLVVNDGTIVLQNKTSEVVSLDDIQASLQHDPAQETAILKIRGKSHQQELAGHFAFEATLDGLDSHGQLLLQPSVTGIPLPEGDGQIHVKMNVQNAAVHVFDQVLTLGHPAWTGLLGDALGETLNLKLDLLLSSSGPSLEIVGDSTNFKADLVTHLSDGNLILERPGIISLKMTPDLFERIWQLQRPGSESTVSLKKDTTLEIEVQRLTLPTRLTQGSNTHPTVRIALRLPDVQLIARDGVGKFSLQDVSGVLERLEASGALVYQLNAAITHLDQHGSLRIAGKLIDQDHTDTILLGDLVVAATKIPTAAFDYLFRTDGLLVGSLGENFDLQAKIVTDSQGRRMDVQMGSDSFAAPSLQFKLADSLQLVKPAQVHMQATPALVRYLLGTNSKIVLEERTSMLLTLNQLTVPLGRQETGDKAIIDAEIATAPFVIGGLTDSQQGRARFSNVKLRANGGKFSDLHFALHTDIAPDGVTPVLTAALGSVSTVELEGILATPSLSDPSFSELRLSLQNELIDARILAKSQSDGSLSLISPATLRYNLKSEALLALGVMQPQVPHLLQRNPVEVRVDDFTVRFNETGPRVVFCRGKASVGELQVVQEAESNPLAILRDVVFSWRYDSTSQLAALVLRAKSEMNKEQGFLEASLDLAQWGSSMEELLRGSIAKLEVNGQHFPLVVVSALTGRKGWSEIIGPTVELSLQGHYGPTDNTSEGLLSLSMSADQFQAKSQFNINSQGATLQADKPMTLSWTVTPDRWQALQEVLGTPGAPMNLPWAVVEPATLLATLNTVTLPLRPIAGLVDGSDDQCVFLSPALAGSITWDGVRIRDTLSNDEATLQNLGLTFETDNVAKGMDFTLQAREQAGESKYAPAEADVTGHVARLDSTKPWLESPMLAVDLSITGKELSLVHLLRYPLQRAAVSQHLPGLIGQRVSGTVQFQLKGPDGHLQASLVGDSGRFEVDGQIAKRILTLRQPLVLELEVTPELRHGLLRDVAPYMAATKSTEKPIRFTVDPVGFSLPVDDLNHARIGQATLEMGKVKIEDNGQLGAVISILQGDRDQDNGTFNVWFTPLNLSLADGILKFSRMDALIADHYPVALWGRIDLIKDHVRMIIGITAQALRNAYSLMNVDDKYMLQLPLTGTIDNASIDKTKATARVTALLAQSQGSAHGAMVGGVLDLLGGGLHDEKVPPPNGPLPWEPASPEGGSKPVAETKPLNGLHKEVKKGAKKLLDALRLNTSR